MLLNPTQCLKGLGPALMLAALALAPTASAGPLDAVSPVNCPVEVVGPTDPCDPGRACDELRFLACNPPVIVCIVSSVVSTCGGGGGDPGPDPEPQPDVCDLPAPDEGGGLVGDLQRLASGLGAHVCVVRDAATGAVTAIVVVVAGIAGDAIAETIEFVGEVTPDVVAAVGAILAAALAAAGTVLGAVGDACDDVHQFVDGNDC